jgi:hypothetical protein
MDCTIPELVFIPWSPGRRRRREARRKDGWI